MAGELTPVDKEQQAIAAVPDLPDWLGLHKHQSLSTFDASTQEGLKLLTRMGAGCDQELGNHVNKELDITGFYMSPYEKLDAKSGELVPLVFIGLVDANGATYSTSSIGVRKSLLILARSFGFKPWIPPVRVVVKSVKLDVGQMYSLEFVSRPEAKPEQKKK